MIVDGVYVFEDKMLVNNAEFTRTRDEFIKNSKNGKPLYTLMHPVYDKEEYRAFWVEERRRRREGYTVGGVTITGQHYNFLNFTQIVRKEDDNAMPKSRAKSKRVDKIVDFPDFWDGHYLLSHGKEEAKNEGLHFIGGKSRRKGFSWFGSAEAANSLELSPRRSIILGAFDKKYITKGDGIFTMSRQHLDFYNQYTEFYHNRLINTTETIKLGFKNTKDGTERGHRGQLLATSFGNNPDAARGKDAIEVYLEELGTFPNLKDVLSATLPAMEDGVDITGQLICWGTGGSEEADWEAFEEIYYNPKAYKFLAFPNIWDEIQGENQTCGYFFPYYQNLIQKNGITQTEPAKARSKGIKEDAKRDIKNVSDYKKFCAERADSPAEAFSRSSVNIFSSPLLDDWIDIVAKNTTYNNFRREGKLYKDKEKFRLYTRDELMIRGDDVHPFVTNYPHKYNEDVEGCFVEWSPPHKLPDGRVCPIYRVWVDPYGTDKDKKEILVRDSLGAIYVYERTNPYTDSKGDLLVACYIGRPSRMDDFNDIIFDIAEYYGGYNGMITFENDRGTVKERAHFRRKSHLLADEPDILMMKNTLRKVKPKGISMNAGGGDRKATAALYFKDWLYQVRKETDLGEPRLNLHYIFDLGLLREIQKFSLKGNFDRLSAIFVGMYDMHEQISKPFRNIAPVIDKNSFFNRRLF